MLVDDKLAKEKRPTVILDRSKINVHQWDMLQRIIARAKQAHFTNVQIRINGKFEEYEADWIKHLLIRNTDLTDCQQTEDLPTGEQRRAARHAEYLEKAKSDE